MYDQRAGPRGEAGVLGVSFVSFFLRSFVLILLVSRGFLAFSVGKIQSSVPGYLYILYVRIKSLTRQFSRWRDTLPEYQLPESCTYRFVSLYNAHCTLPNNPRHDYPHSHQGPASRADDGALARRDAKRRRVDPVLHVRAPQGGGADAEGEPDGAGCMG